MKLPIVLAITLTMLSAQPKEALLIGNSNYQHISDLNDPLSNLKRLKKTLEDLDFNVKIKTDLDSVHLEESIEVFAKRLARSRDTIGFLYYTGHGCQVAHQGYLLPTNVDSKDRLKVKHHALNINEMVERLNNAGNRVNMFFLDACRDVPTSTKGGSKGLGQIKNTPKGTLVVYATKAGETAEDNSDFINSIIKSIKEPKQSIRNLPYSISDRFTQMGTSQMPIFSAVGIPKVVLGGGGGVISTFTSKPTPKPISTSKWITPTNEEVTWKKAKEICRDNGARLPTIEELKTVITNCGAIDNNTINVKNMSYQLCYEQKGFTSSSYWSASSLSSSNAWLLHFYGGSSYSQDKSDVYHVRCVRGRE